MTKTQRRWLLNRLIDEREGALQAEAGSAEDKKLREIEEAGAIRCYDAMFGNNYYDFTPSGRKELTEPPR